MAEAHPVGFRWAMKARERGAKLIHVDPHYSRTTAVSDQFAQIRAGSDIAFLGGLIRHIIETDSYFKEYVVNYTNAATIVGEDFEDTEDLEGYFSGYDPETGTYDRTSWMYEGGEDPEAAGEREHATQAFSEKTGAGMTTGKVSSDETLQHPRCVFQLLKKHYARYTPEMVERVCGIPRETFLEIAETLIANSGRERTTMLVYGVSWTQHCHRRADDPRRRDRPAAARQHRAPGRRHHGDARPRLDPGLERHPHALRPAPRLPADAQGLRGRPHARELHRGGRLARAAGGATSTSTSSRC